MNKTIVIYHRSDFDGIFCREIAKKFLPEAELIGWDYGDPTPGKDIIGGTETLYMLDISVSDFMDHPRLIWIDHHKSAMEKYPFTIPGYRIDGVAACRLAWQWFRFQGPPLLGKEDFVGRLVQEPLAVRLAGEYDVWDKRDPRADLFQHGLRSQDLDGIWPKLLDGSETGMAMVAVLLACGEAIQYAKTQENASIINEISFTIHWEGLCFLCCNHARYNSLLFSAGLKPEHDACFGFKFTGKDWSVSLYHAPGREHHDLSLIAVKYGGGGHKGSCGFRIGVLPFLK